MLWFVCGGMLHHRQQWEEYSFRQGAAFSLAAQVGKVQDEVVRHARGLHNTLFAGQSVCLFVVACGPVTHVLAFEASVGGPSCQTQSLPAAGHVPKPRWEKGHGKEKGQGKGKKRGGGWQKGEQRPSKQVGSHLPGSRVFARWRLGGTGQEY